MRLFIAVNFPGEVKDILLTAQEKLKAHAVSGSYTRPANLHLTLTFLGEIPESRVRSVTRAMAKVESAPFTLRINGAGKFRRGENGDIWWIGFDDCPELLELHRRLTDELARGEGFDIERRKYSPHLTIAREVRTESGFDSAEFSRSIPAAETQVRRISLMKSERIRGVLTYTEIYVKELR